MNDPINYTSQALNHMVGNGIEPPTHIEFDGSLHRYGKDKVCWYVAFSDDPVTVTYGDWRQGGKQTWLAKSDNQLTPAERQALRERIKQAQQKEQEAEAASYRDAAQRAAEEYYTAKPASPDHQYLQKKGIRPPDGIRQTADGRLIVPVYGIAGNIQTLQYINPTGDKLFLNGGKAKGGFFTIGDVLKSDVILICEGMATAASLFEATGHTTIAAMNAGNLKPVSEALNNQHQTKRILICADKDTSGTGEKSAQATGYQYVLPDVETKGDFNDMAASKGLDAVKQRIDAALQQPPTEATGGQVHPLSPKYFIVLDGEPVPPSWVLVGYIAEGVLLFVGGHGGGKTTTAIPLAATAAGIHEPMYKLAPKADHWRHVVYVTEDAEQAKRILSGYAYHLEPYDFNVKDLIKERMHVVEASRMKSRDLVQVGASYVNELTREVDGVKLLPLVVLDTLSANIQMENENDNTEASEVINTLKQRFCGLPLWIVAHTAKANLGKEDLTARGASAFEADVNQVIYLTFDKKTGKRWLTMGKKRFESPYTEIQVASHIRTVQVRDRFGETVDLPLRWAIANPESKNKAQEKAKVEEQEQEEQRAEILRLADEARADDNPLSKTGLAEMVGGNKKNNLDLIADLTRESWLHEVEVPKKERTNNNKKSFVIAFTESERTEFLKSGNLPDHKATIPPSWKNSELELTGTNETKTTSEKAKKFACSVSSNSVSSLKGKKPELTESGLYAPDPVFVDSGKLELTGTDGNQRELTGGLIPDFSHVMEEVQP